MKTALAVFVLIFGLFQADKTLAEQHLEWKQSRIGSYIAVSTPDFMVLFMKDKAGNVTLQVVPLYLDTEIDITYQRPFVKDDVEMSSIDLFNGESVQFSIPDWGGFLAVWKYAETGWFKGTRMFRLYADGSIGMMDGNEFFDRFTTSAGFAEFRRAKREPQYYAPEAASKTATAAATSWGAVKNDGAESIEATTIQDLFRE